MTTDRDLDRRVARAIGYHRHENCTIFHERGLRRWNGDVPDMWIVHCGTCNYRSKYAHPTLEDAAAFAVQLEDPDGEPLCHSDGCTYNLPGYSTDPAACAEVKRRLRDAGIQFAVVDMEGFLVVWVADIQKGTILTHHDKDDPMAEADTEEEAVARFALACAEAGLLEAST